MSLILVLSLQAAAVATPAAPAPPPAAPTSAPRWALIDPAAQRAQGQGDPLDFDLARYRGSGDGSCAGAAAGDVLVCGPRRRGGNYPLDHWARIFGPERPIRAEVGLGGGATADLHAEQHDFGNGRVANRVMVGIKLPF
jgi:hypothetical protein